MKKTIQWYTQEKELRMAKPWGVGIRDNMVAAGMECYGTLSMAAQAHYYTPRMCEKMGHPVQPDEVPTHCAIMANCYTELCLVDAEGNRVRPCLPVFYREAAATTGKPVKKQEVCVDRVYTNVSRATKKGGPQCLNT